MSDVTDQKKQNTSCITDIPFSIIFKHYIFCMSYFCNQNYETKYTFIESTSFYDIKDSILLARQ